MPPAKQGSIGILDRVIERLLAAFPKARIPVCLDGGFGGPAPLNFLGAAAVDYITLLRVGRSANGAF